MKRFALGSLALALGIASTAQAQYYDDRGYGYDDGYAPAYQGDVYADARYQDAGYRDAGYGQDGAHYDVARVLSVEPIVQRGARPAMRQECYEAAPPAYAYDDRYGRGYDDRYGGGYARPRTSGGGAIVGAIVGGALGNTVGHGDERQVATVLGAVIGGAIGNDIERSNRARQDAYYGRDARYDDRYGNGAYDAGYASAGVQCQPVSQYRAEEQVVGYRVNYEYGGRTYQTVTDYHPGHQMRVRVDVAPEG